MDSILSVISQQNWLPALATVVAAVVGIWLFRAGNQWDKVTRDAIKAELEIAKLLHDLNDGRSEAWINLSQSRSLYLFDPARRKRYLKQKRAVVIYLFIAWLGCVLATWLRQWWFLGAIPYSAIFGAWAMRLARKDYERTKARERQDQNRTT